MGFLCINLILFVADTDKKPALPPKNGKCRSVNNLYSNVLAKCSVVPTPGTPDKNLEDYELCLVQKSKKSGHITRLIQTENVFLKKGSNNQLVLHSRISPCQQLLPHQKELSQTYTWGITLKQEDSGYLSTDSNGSQPHKMNFIATEANGGGSETDESLGDGHSESGAESVETHSVFFNRCSQQRVNFGSMDSGVMGEDEVLCSSDSESMSFTTIVPVTTC